MKNINDDRVKSLIKMLKDSYKLRAFEDVEFCMALIKFHSEDFLLELDDESARLIAEALKVKK